MEIQLIDLPQVCLEEIFKKLNFAQISRLGGTCKYFREIVKTIFRLHFKNVEETIEMEMEKIETEANRSENLTVSEHLHLALLHSVLRILLSEAKMLKAHCWRYMKEPTCDFCFPAGVILDEFEKILINVRNKTLKKNMEPEITTTLFHLGETFYDYFDTKIESCFHEVNSKVKIISETNRKTFLPNIYSFVSNITKETIMKDINNFMRKPRESEVKILSQSQQDQLAETNKHNMETDKNEKTLFGVKILDILNCCTSTNFYSLLFHHFEKDGFRLKTNYELRDINVLEALPTVGTSLTTSEKQLYKVCRYIRNNVRWTNLFHPLQDFWMLEDAIEINRDVNTASALLRQWKLQRSSSRLILNTIDSDICQYDYKKVINRFRNRFGLIISATLECPSITDMPLKIQNTFEKKCDKFQFQDLTNCFDGECSSKIFKNQNEFEEINSENWNGDAPIYKFHLELKIQYPSFLSETVREAVLKIDQVGESTVVTSDGDDMRKSATYRVEENYE